MTENLPAVPEAADRAPVAVVDTDSWVAVMRPILSLAEHIYDTDFVPKGLRGNLPATAAAILSGRELGLPPMTALATQHVVEGKPGLSAEGMRMLVLAAGHEIEFDETTGAICTMRGRRRGGSKWTTVTWTIDMARAAGLLNKFNWKAYPRDMLIGRCTTSLCRMIFADVIHGFRSTEELEDMADEDEAAAVAAAPTSTTKVSRARKTAATKKAAAALPAAPAPGAASRPAAPAGPPLPGEDGYETPAGESERKAGLATTAAAPHPPADESAGESDDAPSSSHEDGAGNTEDTPADADTDGVTPEPEAGPVDGRREAPEAGPAEVQTAPPSGPVTRSQVRMIQATFGRLGVESNDREERMALTVALVGREVDSTNKLTKNEASALIDTLARFETREALNGFLDELDAARGQGATVDPS